MVLSNPSDAEEINRQTSEWRGKYQAARKREALFTTISGIPLEPLYTPQDLTDTDYLRDMGMPGEYPYLRGIHPTGHRGRLWTMRMFAGYGTAEETNARFKYLLGQGETGLSIAFDMPTLMGYDHDDSLAAGEFGKCGVAVSSLADMEVLLDGLPIEQITTSMTINSPAAIIWAMYIAAAEKRGVSMDKLGGTLQNDILKEYTAQNEYLFPIEPSMRLVTDTIEFATRHMPRWNPVSISGYHIREAGSTAAQELAFTLANGFAYVDEALARGLDIDDFAPRLSFFFNIHDDFFEEIAKFRAARRIWAREMKERYGAKNERSLWLRTHAQTAGVSLTAQQPENNIARVTIQALAAVLGGVQSLHTNSMDEVHALPSEKAALIALRTQQIIAHESGLADVVDALGGSYYLESLTNELESQAYDYFKEIKEQGGVTEAIKRGFFQREIADAAYRYQRELEQDQRIKVGLNGYGEDKGLTIPILKMDAEGERRHLKRLSRVRSERDNARVSETLEELKRAALGTENLMPYILAAVREYATLGETTNALRETFGEAEVLNIA
ncbi:MAG: methylmalonyl-CoA mutase family protein [Chloroflexi bacterium]|nr:methylmalonyl-CoA mutase family protein [Chloroflexota bacterium]